MNQLVDLCDLILKNMPREIVYEDLYGFTYRGGRDLSGFIDGRFG
jgi:hypothetical protein